MADEAQTPPEERDEDMRMACVRAAIDVRGLNGLHLVSPVDIVEDAGIILAFVTGDSK